MIDVFKGVLKLVQSRKVYIDDMVFRLHCHYTTMLVLFFFLIITSKQFAGEPIACDTNHDMVKESVLNLYCLTHYTYTLERAFHRKLPEEVMAPGLGGIDQFNGNEIHNNYYQWIWLAFLMQAIFFYLPRYLWKNFENGTMIDLISSGQAKDGVDKKTRIASYLRYNAEHITDYARNYFYFLVLAFGNVVAQMTFIDYLFNGQFFKYGFRVFHLMSQNPEVRRDALIMVFPRMAKCPFYKFGTDGTINRIDSLCILPLNMYNEKFFVFLWFWFAILGALLYVSILIKVVLMVSPMARFYFSRSTFKLNNSWPNTGRRYNKSLANEVPSFGELFLLQMVKQNCGGSVAKGVFLKLVSLKMLAMEEKDTNLLGNLDRSDENKLGQTDNV